MARATVSGMKELNERLAGLTKQSGEVVKAALYAGGGKLADAVRGNLESLETMQDGEQRRPGEYILTESQKEDLKESFGVSPIAVKNYVSDIHVGFEGYGRKKTKKYPKGKANAMIARATESGTSFSRKQPFIRPAVNKGKEAVLKSMEEAAIEKIKEQI